MTQPSDPQDELERALRAIEDVWSKSYSWPEATRYIELMRKVSRVMLERYTLDDELKAFAATLQEND